MTHKLSEPNPIPVFRVVTGIGIAIIALWFLTACVPAKQAQLPTTDWGNCAYAESGEISCDNSQTNVVGTLMVNNFNYRTTIDAQATQMAESIVIAESNFQRYLDAMNALCPEGWSDTYWRNTGECGDPDGQVPFTPTPVCPPDDYFSQMTVGYLPSLGLGAKKSPVAITFGCELMTVVGEGWSLSGLLSEDGTKLETCALFADRSIPYPCSLGFANLDNLNVRGFYQNKNGSDFPICLAVDNKHHNEVCE